MTLSELALQLMGSVCTFWIAQQQKFVIPAYVI